jgi:hypothetical protein
LFLINIFLIVFIAGKMVILYKSFYFLFIHGFGGLGIACWHLVPKFTDSNPPEAVGFLGAKKILSTPSFGGEAKPSVPCLRFAACKRSLNGVKVVISAKLPDTILAARISHVVTDVEATGGERGMSKRGGKQWQTTPKNLPRMQHTRAIPVA